MYLKWNLLNVCIVIFSENVMVVISGYSSSFLLMPLGFVSVLICDKSKLASTICFAISAFSSW